MSFAELVTDMTDVCFADLGEAAVYTAPGEGSVSVTVRATVDEPVEQPFVRDIPQAPLRERRLSVWLPRVDVSGAAFSPAKGGMLSVTTSHGTVRTFDLVSQQAADPDRTQWAVREVMP